MKHLRKKLNHIPLLTPARGNAFGRGIAAARAENGQHPTKHLLHERIVFSFLAFRERIGLGATAREISLQTGLHPKTVRNTLNNLADLAHEQGGRWFANEPPDGWFSLMPAKKVDHWSQRFAYTWLLLPSKGAKFQSGNKKCRFSLNHAVMYSFLWSWVDKKHVVRNLTILGLATMLHLNRKTVASLLDDLYRIGLVERHDQGQPLIIRLLPLKDEHWGLFAPPSRSPEVEHVPSTSPARPTSNVYEYKQDGYDEFRRLCKTFMSQSYAERAIRAARVLGWDAVDFHLKLEDSKHNSEENVRSGKCPVENFGRYFVTPLEERVNAIKEEERKVEAEERRLEYLASPEGKEAQADERKAAAADPLHKLHSVEAKSLTDRVQFHENPLKNYQHAEQVLSRVRKHCRSFIETKGWLFQRTVDESGNLYHRVMQRGLSKINQYYQQPVLASPEEFRTAIDEAIVETEPTMAPLFAEAKEVVHAG